MPAAGKKKEESFRNRLARLEKIVELLESDDIELEEALAAFEEGVKLSRACAASLGSAEKRVEILLRQAGGELGLEDFDPGLDEDDSEIEDL